MKTTVPASLAAIGLATMLAVSATTGVAFADDAITDETRTMANPQAEPLDTTPGSFALMNPRPGQWVASGATFVVDFECSDPESGIETCTLRDEDGKSISRGEPLALADGQYTWTGETTNGAGLSSTQQYSFGVGTDVTPPAVGHDHVEPATGWTNDRNIEFTATDDGTGVHAVYVSEDGRSPVILTPGSMSYGLTPGEHTLDYWAWDKRGNASERTSITVRFDDSAPMVMRSEFGTRNSDGEIEVELGSDVDFSFECEDSLSGVEFCGETQLAHQSVDTSTLGEHVITITARDLAQNEFVDEIRYFVVGGPTDPDPTDPDPTDPDPTNPDPTNPDPTDPTVPDVPAGPAGPAAQPAPVRGGAATAQNAPDRLAHTGVDSTVALGIAAFLLAAGGSVLAIRGHRRQRG